MIELEYWSAEWCGPCKGMRSIINELVGAGVNITKIDADQHVDRAREIGIRGIPTFIIRRDGVEVERLVGAKTKNALQLRLQAAELE